MKHFFLAKGFRHDIIVVEMKDGVGVGSWELAVGNGENLTAIATKDTKDTKDGAMMLRPRLGHKETIKDSKVDNGENLTAKV